MVSARPGIFNSQTGGMVNPGARSEWMNKEGEKYGAQGLAGQTDALAMARRGAMGQSPSVAQTQLTNQSAANSAQAMGLAAQGRGGNLAGMQQNALAAGAGAQMQTNRDMGMLRAQEQQAQQAAYASQAQAMSQQQFGYEGLAQQGLATAGQQNIDWQLGSGALDLQKQELDFKKNKAIADGIIGGVGALGSVVGMSDERAKQDVAPTSVSEAAAQLPSYEYDYKPGIGQPEGRQMGVMAQDVANSPLGPTLVREGPDGMLSLDGGRAGVAGLAASGENTRRIAGLEQRLLRSEGRSPDEFRTPEHGARAERSGWDASNAIQLERGRAEIMPPPPRQYDFDRGPQMAARGGGPRGTVDPFYESSGSKTIDRLRSDYPRLMSDVRVKDDIKEMPSTREKVGEGMTKLSNHIREYMRDGDRPAHAQSLASRREPPPPPMLDFRRGRYGGGR